MQNLIFGTDSSDDGFFVVPAKAMVGLKVKPSKDEIQVRNPAVLGLDRSPSLSLLADSGL